MSVEKSPSQLCVSQPLPPLESGRRSSVGAGRVYRAQAALNFCGIGSSGVPRPSLAPYVTGMGPTDGATAAGGHGPQGNPVQFPDSDSIPTSSPSEFPRIYISGRALRQNEIDAAIQTTSTSKVSRVDFGGCGPAQPPKSDVGPGYIRGVTFPAGAWP
jgi:hypothetical protein